MAELLVLDIGNTNTTIGRFRDDLLEDTWRVQTNLRYTSDELGIMLLNLYHSVHPSSPLHLDGVVISSVVPGATSTYVRAIEAYFGTAPMVIGPGIRTGIAIRYEDPREVGSDRVANAVAVLAQYGAPAIIVDLGTATTVSVIDEQGAYLGGAIAPGVRISTDALIERAARLPQVELKWPERLVQRNTAQSMQAGILFGTATMVDGLVRRIRNEIPLNYTVVATGGLSALFSDRLETVDTIDPNLTLTGLRLLWERNRQKPRS